MTETIKQKNLNYEIYELPDVRWSEKTNRMTFQIDSNTVFEVFYYTQKILSGNALKIPKKQNYAGAKKEFAEMLEKYGYIQNESK
jgi:hypothetical protein